MRVLNTFLAVVVAVLVVLFAISNRAPVVVEIWPFPYQLQLGLYAVILLAVFIGFLAGLITAWLMGGKRRRELRTLRREAKDLHASRLQANLAQASLARANAAAASAPTATTAGVKDLPMR